MVKATIQNGAGSLTYPKRIGTDFGFHEGEMECPVYRDQAKTVLEGFRFVCEGPGVIWENSRPEGHEN